MYFPMLWLAKLSRRFPLGRICILVCGRCGIGWIFRNWWFSILWWLVEKTIWFDVRWTFLIDVFGSGGGDFGWGMRFSKFTFLYLVCMWWPGLYLHWRDRVRRWFVCFDWDVGGSWCWCCVGICEKFLHVRLMRWGKGLARRFEVFGLGVGWVRWQDNEHSRSMDTRHHAIRQDYVNGDMRIGGVASQDNESDILTKFLQPPYTKKIQNNCTSCKPTGPAVFSPLTPLTHYLLFHIWFFSRTV